MIKSVTAAVATVAILLLSIGPAVAQPSCPGTVAQAREMLNKKLALNPDDVQAPRSQAGSRQVLTQAAPRGNQDIQSPRGKQDVQSPRGNENVQAPRGSQDMQAPRGNQDVQAPRENQNVQASRGKLTKAASLVEEAEAACRSGNMAVASQKAKAALKLLK